MKYNKSEIMKNAWEIRKTSGVTMSVALKKAWNVAKAPKLPEMVGTPKQIAWAIDIRNSVIAALDAKIAAVRGKRAAHLIPRLEAGKTYFARLFAVPYFQEAHNVIEKRRHLLNPQFAVTDTLDMSADEWEKKIASWAAL